jgi:hypothetical protein
MRTTADWIAHAEADGGDLRGGLAEAERVAERADDLLAVAQAWLRSGEPAEAWRCLEAGVERADGEIWPARRLAELALALGDEDRARAILDTIRARLEAPRYGTTQAYQWALLARAHREVVGDEAAVRACLGRAAANAESAKDVADLARAHVELAGDLTTARAQLERAETRALTAGGDEIRDLWSIAIVWKEPLGDPVRARRALDLATAAAEDVGTLTSLATAWRSLFDDEARLGAALARAEGLAATAADWLAAAEGHRDGGRDGGPTWDPDAVRRCLEAAVAADPPPTAEERNEIAAGFRRWLGDDGRAAEVAPPPGSFDDAPRARRLDGFTAGAHALLDALRARITPASLDAIARADYGMSFDKHRAGVAELHDHGRFAPPLDWYPREVLELTRWSRGEDTDHVARAFACAVLALDGASPETRQIGDLADVLAPAIESAWALDLVDEVEALLVWVAEVVDDAAPLGWALLGLILSVARRAPDDPRVPDLVAALDAAAADPDAPWPGDVALPLPATGPFFQPLWHALAAEVLGPARAGRDALAALAGRVLGPA